MVTSTSEWMDIRALAGAALREALHSFMVVSLSISQNVWASPEESKRVIYSLFLWEVYAFRHSRRILVKSPQVLFACGRQFSRANLCQQFRFLRRITATPFTPDHATHRIKCMCLMGACFSQHRRDIQNWDSLVGTVSRRLLALPLLPSLRC